MSESREETVYGRPKPEQERASSTIKELRVGGHSVSKEQLWAFFDALPPYEKEKLPLPMDYCEDRGINPRGDSLSLEQCFAGMTHQQIMNGAREATAFIQEVYPEKAEALKVRTKPPV